MMRNLLLILIIVLLKSSALAVETQTESETPPPSADGIVKLNDNFIIFPDNKLGNTIYFKRKKLISRDDLTLIDVVEAPDGYVYHGLDDNGNSILGFEGNPEVKFIPLQGGFYQLITGKIGKKKIYWINGDRKIEDLLPRRNTGTGLVFNGIDKAAFYHIAKGETIETEEGRERYQYTFRLHVADTKIFRIRHLPISVKDFSFKLRLEWLDESTIQYTLGNGQVETVAIR